ncbi:MAG: hypothetical protein JSW61_10555 [Candidatus Thorarchaeota archaeon]|nr:MAG: hypothetical protein JSW61_10555 [Candidatus Thorarchaeota archaeon]
MEAIIDGVWQILYSNNPKIQAFAVSKDSKVIWQTSNWDPSKQIGDLLAAVDSAASSVTLNKVTYDRVSSNVTSYVSSNGKGQGHLLMARVEKGVWLIAWATPESVPELAAVDLQKTAIDLTGQL